jgi:hypothetical protein
MSDPRMVQGQTANLLSRIATGNLDPMEELLAIKQRNNKFGRNEKALKSKGSASKNRPSPTSSKRSHCQVEREPPQVNPNILRLGLNQAPGFPMMPPVGPPFGLPGGLMSPMEFLASRLQAQENAAKRFKSDFPMFANLPHLIQQNAMNQISGGMPGGMPGAPPMFPGGGAPPQPPQQIASNGFHHPLQSLRFSTSLSALAQSSGVGPPDGGGAGPGGSAPAAFQAAALGIETERSAFAVPGARQGMAGRASFSPRLPPFPGNEKNKQPLGDALKLHNHGNIARSKSNQQR